MALAPCLLGYGAVAKMLHTHESTRRGAENVYWPWIQNYVADDYVQAVRLGSGSYPLYPALESCRLPNLVPTSCESEQFSRTEKEYRLKGRHNTGHRMYRQKRTCS